MGTITPDVQQKLIDSFEISNQVIEKIPRPAVSVVTLAYNHELYIEECLNGVLMQQTSFEYEYIIGEDFSSDNTREIILRYAKKYPNRIRVVTADYNVGGAANIYRTFNRARGKYIALCEGDDYWTDPGKLQKQFDILEKNQNCQICFHAAVIKAMNKKKDNEFIDKRAESDKIFSVNDVIIGGGNFIKTASIMVRKEAIYVLSDRLQSRPVGDYFLQIAASIKGGAYYINDVMSVYRFGVEHSFTSRASDYPGKIARELKLCNSLRNLDRATDYNFSKAFKTRENRSLHLLLKKLYLFDDEVVLQIKKMIDSETSGLLKLKCYRELILSYIYHRMKIKIITDIVRKFRVTSSADHSS